MKFIMLIFLIMSSYTLAEIPRDFKEQISKEFGDDELFKRALIDYIEIQDNLYIPKNHDNSEVFKANYTKYLKSKNCIGFLGTGESLSKALGIFSKITEHQQKYPTFAKVTSLINQGDIVTLKYNFSKTASCNGYKDCNFKVSDERIEATLSKLNDQTIISLPMPINEKIKFLSKNNVIIKKSLDAVVASFTDYFTNKTLSDKALFDAEKKIEDDINCLLYFTPEEKLQTALGFLHNLLQEISTLPNYDQQRESKLNIEKIFKTDLLKGSADQCSFKVDPTEIKLQADIKIKEKEKTDKYYTGIQEVIKKSHPKIRELVSAFEQNVNASIPDKSLAKKMFIDKFPLYLKQINQTLSFSLYEMLSDPKCKSELIKKVELCSKDERFKLVNDQGNLLLLLCSEEYKPELQNICKYPANAEK